MLTMLKLEPALLFRFMKYAVAASHPKINRRFVSPRSKEYWQCFESVNPEDISFHDVQPALKRKRLRIELENDRKFLIILGKGKIAPNYEEQFPNIANVVKELPNMTDETSPRAKVTAPGHCTTTFELFNDTTWKEYHRLFMALMVQYRTLMKNIASEANDGGPFEVNLDRAVETGHALLTMVKGRAFYLYLSTIAPNLSMHFSEDSQIESEERDAEAGTTLWDPVEVDPSMVLWKPFKAWVMLILVQLDAADALCAFVKQAELSNAEIDVKVVYSPIVSAETIPLEDLLAQTDYIPDAPITDPKTNAKLLDFVKTANTLKSQAGRVASFKKKWDPKHASDAKSFLQQILDETKKEHEEDGKQRNGGDDSKKIISELCSQIIELLSRSPQDAGADIPMKFSALEIELKDRQARYNLPFTERATFKGTLHCEAGLASILDKTTRESIRARIETLNQADGKKKDEKLYRSLSQLLEDTKVVFFPLFNLFLSLIPVLFTMIEFHTSHWGIKTLLPSVPSFSRLFIVGWRCHHQQLCHTRFSQYHHELHLTRMDPRIVD
jgi:hypothetical protein